MSKKEPVFLLVGSDPLSGDLIREWSRRYLHEPNFDKQRYDTALRIAEQCDAWISQEPRVMTDEITQVGPAPTRKAG